MRWIVLSALLLLGGCTPGLAAGGAALGAAVVPATTSLIEDVGEAKEALERRAGTIIERRAVLLNRQHEIQDMRIRHLLYRAEQAERDGESEEAVRLYEEAERYVQEIYPSLGEITPLDIIDEDKP